MAELKQPGTLELHEDIRFQHLEPRAARATWLALLSLMFAASLGLFGQGQLSRARIGEPGGPLLVEYSRFGRYGATMRLTVQAQPSVDGQTHVGLSQSLLKAFRITQITPTPAAARIGGDGADYSFDTGAEAVAPVIFEMQPAARWLVRGTVRSSGHHVRLTQLIYP